MMSSSRKDASSFDDMQGSLEEHAKAIGGELGKNKPLRPSVVLSHFVLLPNHGTDKGQFLRRSGVRVSPDVSKQLLVQWPELRDVAQRDELQRQVHGQFISYLDRDNTFLDYIVRKIDAKRSYVEPIVLRFEFGGSVERSLPGEYLVQDGVFRIDEALAESVCPRASARQFLRELYLRHGRASHTTDWNLFFYMRRVLASQEFHRPEPAVSPDPAERLCAESREINTWQAQLSELSGIQSALSYMGTLSTLSTASSEFSVAVSIRQLSQSGEQFKSLSITMASFAHDRAVTTEEQLSGVHQFLRKKRAPAALRDDNGVSKQRFLEACCSHGDLSFSASDKENLQGLTTLRDQIRADFRNHPFQEQIELHGITGLVLMQRILGEIHEKQRLDFFFVCGELSVFADKAILRRFSDAERALFAELKVSDVKETADARSRLSRATEFIAREHYPWFEDGRHALFWDCSSADERPCGLIKLKEGNWKQVALARNYKSTPLRIPDCLLLYSLGTEALAGMLYLKPPLEAQATTADLARAGTLIGSIVAWNRDRWGFQSNSIETELQSYLSEAFPDSHAQEWIAQLSRIVARTASDEQRGGTIVVAKGNGDQTPFREMGKALDVQPTGYDADDLVDRVKLISHDGASVVCVDPANGRLARWRHRRYLFPGGDERLALESLFNKLEESRETQTTGPKTRITATHHPLRWKGTRRWAAAAAAFNSHVKLSVVISQDGDVQVWHVKPVEPACPPRKIQVLELTKAGLRNQYEHEYSHQLP